MSIHEDDAEARRSGVMLLGPASRLFVCELQLRSETGRKGDRTVNTNVNLEAAVGALALAGAGLVTLLLAGIVVHALVTRRRARARRVAFIALAAVALYLAGMIVFSLASREKVLARGEEKYFCEIDCHLAYSVAGVRRAKRLGTPGHEAAAAGEFYVVEVRTRFDETTISPRRGPSPLTPNPRAVRVLDDSGTVYAPAPEGQRTLELAGEAGPPLSTPLRPGESYTTRLVFDLPEGVHRPTLLINESDLPTRFIIGHENSLLHRQTTFMLTPPESARQPS
jgi:hypothetical protein